MKANAPACRAPVLIVGAGLSGLTTARLLTNAGIPNIVFEASLRDRSQGFSISLRDWGYSALLQSLGDLPLSSLTKFTAPDRYYGADGWIDQILRDNTTGRALVAPDPEDKASIVRANRNALREWITDGGEDDVDVRYDHNFVKCTGGTGNIVAWFENGSSYPGSLLIAADGVHSAGMCILLFFSLDSFAAHTSTSYQFFLIYCFCLCIFSSISSVASHYS